MTRRILITGGAGFIGWNLVEELLKDENNFISVIDNFYSSKREDFQKYFEMHPRLEIIMGDVDAGEYSLAATFGKEKIDQIYHLACPASPKFYQKDPIKTLDTCYLGTKHMLELAKTTGATLLFTSTSEIYGDPLEHPQREDYRGNVNPIGPRANYNEGKRIGETLCFEYHRKYGIDIRVARLFNTYGPRMRSDDGRVVSNFIVQALKGSKLTIYGDGSQTRSFCYISDTVRALIALMNSSVIGPVNLGNPDEHTILQLAEKIKRLIENRTDHEISFIYKELPQDDPTRRKPVIHKAKTELQWKPEIVLDDGLEKTITYFQNYLS